MVSHLYEALSVAQDATPEQIRKAYRKKALQTHPDRLPPGASASDKSKAEEEFRKVNNAYEVLSDEQKRREYDRHGEYPPPEPQPDLYDRHAHRRSSRHRSQRHQPPVDPFFNNPFFSNAFESSSRSNHFAFTDPFALFESIFGDMRRHMDDPFFTNAVPSHHDPLSRNRPFGTSSMFDRLMDPHSAFPMLPPMDNIFPGQSRHSGPTRSHSFSATSSGVFARGGGGDGQWVTQSKFTRSINGVTESVFKRTDSHGNEHITYSYPDGRQRYLINGVEQEQPPVQQEQSRQGLLPPSHHHRDRDQPLPPRIQTENSYSQPPPPYPGPPPHHATSAGQYAGGRHAHRSHATQGPYNSANIKNDMEHERHHRERIHEDTRAHRKKWWRGEF